MRSKLGLTAILVLASTLGASSPASAQGVDCEHLGAVAIAAERARKSWSFRTYDRRRLVALTLAECAYRKEADPALRAAVGDRRFARLSAADRRRTLSAAALNAWNLDQTERALALYRRAIEVDPSDPDDWYRQANLLRIRGDNQGAARSLIHLVEHWPELLDNLSDDHIFPLIYGLDSDSQVRLDLLQALFDANWQRRGQGASAAWYELAEIRMNRGDVDAARAAIRRISMPSELIHLRIDRRFDGIVDRDAPAFDIEQAAAQKTGLYRSLASIHPDSLEMQSRLGHALLDQGRNEEALAHANRVLGIIAESDAKRAPYKDMGEEIWVMNMRGIALLRLGRYDEALLELQRASRRDEGGGVNVSLALNLGLYYAALGRADEALAASARAGAEINGYGRMLQAYTRLRAALLKNDGSGVQRELEYLREHRADGQMLLIEALLHAGRLDEAEQRLLERLASAEGRAPALYWMQRFRAPEPLPEGRGLRVRKAELIARPSVQKAVGAVGRIESYDIVDYDWMD